MTDEWEVLLKAFDTLPIRRVIGPDCSGRVGLELDDDGLIDLGPEGGPAAAAALIWSAKV